VLCWFVSVVDGVISIESWSAPGESVGVLTEETAGIESLVCAHPLVRMISIMSGRSSAMHRVGKSRCFRIVLLLSYELHCSAYGVLNHQSVFAVVNMVLTRSSKCGPLLYAVLFFGPLDVTLRT
jgi:hypothetical protein